MNEILSLKTESIIPYSSFEVIDQDSSCGLVAKVKKNGEFIAIKIFLYFDLSDLISEYECLHILTSKKSRNIVKFRSAHKYDFKSLLDTEGFKTNKALNERYNSAYASSDIYVFEFDYYYGFNLEDIIYREPLYNARNVHKIIFELVNALKICHNCMIVHHDLSSKNVFFDSENKLTVLLDFGNAELKKSNYDQLYREDIIMLGRVLYYLISKKTSDYFFEFTDNEKQQIMIEDLDECKCYYTNLIKKCITETSCCNDAINLIYNWVLFNK